MEFLNLPAAQGNVVIEPVLLDLLRCPETGQGVSVADAKLLETVEAKRLQGGLFDGGGRPVSEAICRGLVRSDGKVLFPIVRGIPVMLIDQAVLV